MKSDIGFLLIALGLIGFIAVWFTIGADRREARYRAHVERWIVTCNYEHRNDPEEIREAYCYVEP